MKQRREDGKGREGSYKDEDELACLLSEGGLNKRMSEGVSKMILKFRMVPEPAERNVSR